MKKNATPAGRQGFTLIELLLYLVIVSVVVGALVPFAWNMVRSSVKSSVQENVASNITILSERIKSEIRNSNGINIADSNFAVNLSTNPGSKLSLQNDSPNDPTLIDVLNGQLRIKQGSSAYIVLNPSNINVTNITFLNYSSSDLKTQNVGFTITISSNYSGTRQEYKQSATIESGTEVRSN